MSSMNTETGAAEGILAPSVMESALVTVDPAVGDGLRAGIAAVAGREVSIHSETSGDDGRPMVHIGPGLPVTMRSPIAWLHSTNAGVDPILRDERWRASTLLTRTVGRMDRRVAEYVLAWILADGQCVVEYTEQSRTRRWQRRPYRLIEGDLAVVFGAGRMGGAVGRLLRACGVRVTGVATTPRSGDSFDDVVDREGAARVIPAARWLVAALPLTPSTDGYFNDGIFGLAHEASFLNVGRGPTVDQDALQRALETGSLKGAVLDVLPEEPPPPASGWWTLPNTTLTPHTAGITEPADVLTDFRSCWETLRQGLRPDLAVDPHRGY
jgi:phosphoglycerate dehydrogenase-like enzyme